MRHFMMSSSWLFWMAFMFLFLAIPVGYGSGFRRWGPPYPRYIQRRRGVRAATASGTPPLVSAEAWGWGGDFVWLVLLIGASWAFASLWWR